MPRGFTRTTIATLPLMLGILGSSAAAQALKQPIPLQRYGWETPEGPTRSATLGQRRSGGAMLSRVADMAEAADGALYVLDGDLAKVVVFNTDGSLRRIIGNGKGEGPGEFIGPNSLSLSNAGEVFVLDLRLGRVTVFDTAGPVTRTIPIGLSGPLQVRVGHDSMYIVGPLLRPGPVVQAYSFPGRILTKQFVPTSEDLLYGRTGNGYRMVQLRDGRWALGHPNPGTWSLLDSPATVLGRTLVPQNAVKAAHGGRIFEAFATLRGLGELSGGRMLVLFEQRSTSWLADPENTAIRTRLVVLKSNGSVAEELALGDIGSRLLVSRTSNEFYLPINEPFPQVVRYRLPAP